MKLKSIAIFCGSNFGRNPKFREATQKLADEFVKRQITLVYGGGHVGLMGELANTILAAQGKVIGVIPQFLVDKEIAHPHLSELIVTDCMHTRKKAIAKQADAFLMLPGGTGTLEEFFEAWTWSQLGLQHKPLGIFNIDHYFDALIHFLDTTVSENFVSIHHRNYITVESNPQKLIEKLEESEIVYRDKWEKTESCLQSED